MNPRPSPTSLRVALVAIAAVLGLGSLAVRARFDPPVPSPAELLWLATPALLAASAAVSIPDRRGASWLLAGVLVSVAFTAIAWLQLDPDRGASATTTLVPTVLPLWQLGLPIVLWSVVWSVQVLQRPARPR